MVISPSFSSDSRNSRRRFEGGPGAGGLVGEAEGLGSPVRASVSDRVRGRDGLEGEGGKFTGGGNIRCPDMVMLFG